MTDLTLTAAQRHTAIDRLGALCDARPPDRRTAQRVDPDLLILLSSLMRPPAPEDGVTVTLTPTRRVLLDRVLTLSPPAGRAAAQAEAPTGTT